MEKYQNFATKIEKFFKINPSENFDIELFGLLKEIIDFESGYIFFVNPERLEYSFNPQTKQSKCIKENFLMENLTFKNSVFGKIYITGNKFDDNDKKIFKACSSIIANITKDIEISKIIKMQVDALEKGYYEVQKSNKKILEAEKIKSKFLSHVSHELRTPLNSILGFSELMANGFAGPITQKQQEYLNDIKASGINLLGMINEVLDMSKIESNMMKLTRKEFMLNDLIIEIENIIAPLLIKKDIKFTKKIDKSIKIKADYQKIQQVLFNLLSNAIKYTDKCGKVELRAVKEDNFITISIKDNGIGIDKKYHKKIFNKFEQVGESQANSTGLGLTITREIVKLHGGTIDVKSTPDIGSEFIVRLPQI